MTDVFTWPVGHAAEEQAGFPSDPAPFGWTLAYIIGATVGGAATGSIVAGLGGIAGQGPGLVVTVLLVAALGVALLAIWLEYLGRVRPLPQRRAQVPRHWLGWRHRSLTALAFGLMIGSGVLTYLEHTVAYVLVVVVLLSGAPIVGIAIGGAYGMTRGIALLTSWIATRLGKHVAWERLIESRQMVHRLVAITGGASVAIMVAVSVGWTP